METPPRPSPLTAAAFAYAGTTVLALAVLPHLETPLETFGAAHAGALLLGREPLQGLLWGLALGGALAAAGQGIIRWTAWGRRLSRILSRIVGSLHPADALLLAGLSALAEEILFRGLLLPYAGLLASSLAFGAAHLIPRQGLWPWSLWAAGAGLALGWITLATGGLLAAISAHFAVNAVGLLLLAERAE
ncbi:MAG: CPBP family intramembrane glutamic endopeptidase [Deferrisomatales bacterium]|nr:CPBP family intramembrane glutamic endopeptidase [Deferrisomatales bacterium]